MEDCGQEKSTVIQVALHWKEDPNLQTIYVNQMSITHTGPEFYLVFGELVMPAIVPPGNFPDELEIVPKVRLAITPAQMEVISDVIAQNVQGYLDNLK